MDDALIYLLAGFGIYLLGFASGWSVAPTVRLVVRPEEEPHGEPESWWANAS